MFFDVLRIVLVLALFEYLVRPSVKKARVCLTLRREGEFLRNARERESDNDNAVQVQPRTCFFQTRSQEGQNHSNTQLVSASALSSLCSLSVLLPAAGCADECMNDFVK
jgi:hypothetical protein